MLHTMNYSSDIVYKCRQMHVLSLYIKLHSTMPSKLDLRNDNAFMALCIHVHLFKVLPHVVFLHKLYQQRILF